jgi:hypothetical protein
MSENWPPKAGEHVHVGHLKVKVTDVGKPDGAGQIIITAQNPGSGAVLRHLFDSTGKLVRSNIDEE